MIGGSATLCGSRYRLFRCQKTLQTHLPDKPMDRIPNAADLTVPELLSLRLVARGFMSRTIPKAHQARLIELGLIQSLMGGLMVTPMGRMVGRV